MRHELCNRVKILYSTTLFTQTKMHYERFYTKQRARSYRYRPFY